MSSNYAGIDYGLGETNIDRETGIRFGVISAHDLNEWWQESFEDQFTPRCPKCGNDAEDYDEVVNRIEAGEVEGISDEGELSNYRKHSTADFVCTVCGIILGSDDVYGDEPDATTLDDGEYKAEYHSDGDIFIVKSPYYTHAQFCSPCAPGAGHLGNPCPTGPRTYCFGHDWFEGDKAPYPVYEVKTGKLVEPKP